MAVTFEPDKLCMLSETGRLYHPADERVGGAGLIRSTLSIELSNRFVYESETLTDAAPVGFDWNNQTQRLTNELRELLMRDVWRLSKTS